MRASGASVASELNITFRANPENSVFFSGMLDAC